MKKVHAPGKQSGGGKKISGKSRTGRPIGLLSKVSDNPFDILSQSLYRRSNADTQEHPPKQSVIEDSAFEQLLTRRRAEAKDKRENLPYGIFTSMTVVVDTELHDLEQKMYKFPFEMDTRNDGSVLFTKLYSEYLLAIKSVFRKYKEGNFRFFMKLGPDFLVFDSSLRATSGLRRELEQNEIEFGEEGPLLVIKEAEIPLVFDYMANIPLSPSLCIPFILSERSFENGILFSVKLRKRHVVREGSRTLHSYELVGPFWADDHKELVRLHTRIV